MRQYMNYVVITGFLWAYLDDTVHMNFRQGRRPPPVRSHHLHLIYKQLGKL